MAKKKKDPKSDLQTDDIWLQKIKNKSDRRLAMDDDLLTEALNHLNDTIKMILDRLDM